MERLGARQALELYKYSDLHHLGRLAHNSCCQKHPEDWRTFVIDRNINYTNVCSVRCKFCAFSVDEGDGRSYVLDREALLGKIDQLVAQGGTQVLLQGGMHEGLEFEWYLQMVRDIRTSFPGVQIHAFSPPEIWFFHRHYGLAVETVIARLHEAGLDSIPGGGAEILVDRVRQIVSPRKCGSEEWLSVMRTAHRLGLQTTATMMFGHVESEAERIEHLLRLRELQDESLAAGRGHFTAFICWTFQPGNTVLAGENLAAAGPGEPLAAVGSAGATSCLRTLAIARLVLDNFDNLQGSWVTQGPKIGQLSLFYGANDMGGVMMEENVVAAAGTSFSLSVGQMRRLIADAGYQPRQRNGFYELLD